MPTLALVLRPSNASLGGSSLVSSVPSLITGGDYAVHLHKSACQRLLRPYPEKMLLLYKLSTYYSHPQLTGGCPRISKQLSTAAEKVL